MPRWLQGWLALSLGSLWALVGYMVIMYATAHGQPQFSPQDRYSIQLVYPGGDFSDDFRSYHVCDGGTWQIIDAYWDRTPTGRGCVKKP